MSETLLFDCMPSLKKSCVPFSSPALFFPLKKSCVPFSFPFSFLGKWLEAVDLSFANKPVPAQIELMIEGVDIGAGSVKAMFTTSIMNLQVSDEFAFTVWTGLKLTGTKADDAKGQLANATGWTLDRKAAGDTFRTGGVKTPPQWQTDARGAMNTVFESEKQTSMGAENKKDIWFGSWALKEIDTGDIAVLFAADQRFGAGILIHEFVEQYNGQVLGKNQVDSHAEGVKIEAKIVAGGGARGQRHTPIPGEPNKLSVTFEYQGGIIFTMTLDKEAATNFSDVTVRRP